MNKNQPILQRSVHQVFAGIAAVRIAQAMRPRTVHLKAMLHIERDGAEVIGNHFQLHLLITTGTGAVHQRLQRVVGNSLPPIILAHGNADACAVRQPQSLAGRMQIADRRDDAIHQGKQRHAAGIGQLAFDPGGFLFNRLRPFACAATVMMYEVCRQRAQE